ncbi:radical SAM protein [Planctomycetota bacterium]
MSEPHHYIFGPVPSRRLGRSLGVDIVPAKFCTLDCVYCQVGHTTEKTLERRCFVDIEAVVAELQKRLAAGTCPDYITLSGSGEPTLNADLGLLIDRIKTVTNVPVALITNGTLLCHPEVRADCCKADVILPSLDAADDECFRRVNRPHADLTTDTQIRGLEALRRDYPGPIWLEVFVIEGMNTQPEHMQRLRDLIDRLGPDKVHLNTAVRPTADAGIVALESTSLDKLALELGSGCEVIADYSRPTATPEATGHIEDILTMLRRRPCSQQDIAAGLDIGEQAVKGLLQDLCDRKRVETETRGSRTFFKIADDQ